MKRIFKNIVMSLLALVMLSTCVLAAEPTVPSVDEAIPGYRAIGIELPVDFL